MSLFIRQTASFFNALLYLLLTPFCVIFKRTCVSAFNAHLPSELTQLTHQLCQFLTLHNNNVVAHLLSKELSISEAVEQYSIGKSTISYWLRIAREQAGCGTLPNKGNPKLMASLKLPKGVTYLQAHTAVNAKAFMSETDFGQFCRKHGYLASTVDAWAEWFNNHPDAVDKKLHDAQMSAMSELKKENARKDREIARKDKALADAATMLMLSKKAEAIWGAKES